MPEERVQTPPTPAEVVAGPAPVAEEEEEPPRSEPEEHKPSLTTSPVAPAA